MIDIFAKAEYKVARADICDWLKKDDDSSFQKIPDIEMAIFLNGFINEKRGKKDGPQPQPEQHLDNNIIFRKLKIALNLQAEDVVHLLELAEFKVSKHELSAFFRRPTHRHFRMCKDQILRNFLKGIQIKYRS